MSIKEIFKHVVFIIALTPFAFSSVESMEEKAPKIKLDDVLNKLAEERGSLGTGASRSSNHDYLVTGFGGFQCETMVKGLSNLTQEDFLKAYIAIAQTESIYTAIKDNKKDNGECIRFLQEAFKKRFDPDLLKMIGKYNEENNEHLLEGIFGKSTAAALNIAEGYRKHEKNSLPNLDSKFESNNMAIIKNFLMEVGHDFEEADIKMKFQIKSTGKPDDNFKKLTGQELGINEFIKVANWMTQVASLMPMYTNVVDLDDAPPYDPTNHGDR